MKKGTNRQDIFAKDFKKLEVWKKAVALSEKIHKLAKRVSATRTIWSKVSA